MEIEVKLVDRNAYIEVKEGKYVKGRVVAVLYGIVKREINATGNKVYLSGENGLMATVFNVK